MSTNSERIVGKHGAASQQAWPLHDVAHTRQLETVADAGGGLSLMQEAGLALAHLTLAVAPQAKRIWIACGPGNNGGDGLEAARHLHLWGKQPVVSLVHDPASAPRDARQAWTAACEAGVAMQSDVPAQFDVCIDALFGIGSMRPLSAPYSDWAECMNTSAATTIAVDIPTGLDANSGTTQKNHVRADHTLSMLTLKPGLFTANGRDACGDIWFNQLGADNALPAQAWLVGPPPLLDRPHASHKGSFGDVAIVGGSQGMTGAALLAAHSALHGGAGRVFVCLLDANAPSLDTGCPELMVRAPGTLDWAFMTVVAGCGGGQDIANQLPTLMHEARHLVLDADALNHIALQPALQAQLRQRPAASTVITPHPLEAARLLGCSVAEVQADRIGSAQKLAQRYDCVVVLKGSGTLIAAPNETPRINPTGNAKLATAGTGDVLAGLIGAVMAQGTPVVEAACAAVYRHGLAADRWPGPVLHASELCQRI